MGLNVFSCTRLLSDQDPHWCVREVERIDNDVLVDVETSYPLDVEVTQKLELVLRNGNGSRLRLCIRYFCTDPDLGMAGGALRCYEPAAQLELSK